MGTLNLYRMASVGHRNALLLCGLPHLHTPCGGDKRSRPPEEEEQNIVMPPPRSLLGTEGMNRVRARFPPFLGTWPARAYHLPGLDDEMPYVA